MATLSFTTLSMSSLMNARKAYQSGYLDGDAEITVTLEEVEHFFFDVTEDLKTRFEFVRKTEPVPDLNSDPVDIGDGLPTTCTCACTTAPNSPQS